jgi:hypothetical protein
MAGSFVVGHAAAPDQPACPFHLDADAAGCPLLYQGPCRAFGGRGQLTLKAENGNWKMEIGNWKLENGN